MTEEREHAVPHDWVEGCRAADKERRHERGMERGVPTDV